MYHGAEYLVVVAVLLHGVPVPLLPPEYDGLGKPVYIEVSFQPVSVPLMARDPLVQLPGKQCDGVGRGKVDVSGNSDMVSVNGVSSLSSDWSFLEGPGDGVSDWINGPSVVVSAGRSGGAEGFTIGPPVAIPGKVEDGNEIVSIDVDTNEIVVERAVANDNVSDRVDDGIARHVPSKVSRTGLRNGSEHDVSVQASEDGRKVLQTHAPRPSKPADQPVQTEL